MKSKHLLLPVLTALSFAAEAMPNLLFSHSDEQRNLQIRFPQSGPGFVNSELQCSTDLTSWVTEADPPTMVDGSDYLLWRTTTDKQEFFRVVSREPYAFDPPTAAGEGEFMLRAEDGKLRRIRVYIPEGYPGGPPPAPPTSTGPVLCPPAWPLAIICHGSGQTSAEFSSRHPDLITKCNTEGVILVIPQGTRNPIVPPHKHSWNSQEFIDRRDDVLFTIRLVERLRSGLNIDDDRIYIGGFSNGGVFSQLAAVRTPRVFAAAAAVGSSAPSSDRMDPTTQPVCPAPGLPILLVNGKIDWARPFYGGGSCPLPTTPVGGVCPSPPILGSAPDMAAWWVGVNDCPSASTLTALPDHDPAHFILSWPGLTSPDISQQIRDDLNASLPSIGSIETWCPQVYPCPDSFEVNLVSVNALGHTWPDAADNTGYDANEEVIDFFLSHRKVPVKDDGNFAAVARTAGGTRGPLTPDGPNALNVIHSIPATAKAIVFVCHGTNQDSTFVDCVEMTDTLDDLTAAGIGWIAFDSDLPGNWDLVNGLGAGNQDLQNALAIRNTLMAMGLFGPDRPLYTMGYDQGALFAVLLGRTLELQGDPIKGVAQLCPDLDVPPPGATANAALTTALPHYLFVTECDHVGDKLRALNYYHRIRYRSQAQMDFSRMCVSVEKCPDGARFNRIVPAVNGTAIMTVLDNQGFIALDGGAWRRDFCKDQLAGKLQALTFPPALGLTAEQEKEVRGQVRVIFAAHEPDAGCAAKLTKFFCETVDWERGDPANPDR